MKRALSLLWDRRGPVVGLAMVVIPFGLLTSGCLIGLPVLAYGLGRLAAVLVGGARGEEEAQGRLRPSGALSILAIACLAVAMVAGGSAAELVSSSPWVVVAGAFASAVAVGAALSPFAFAPLVLADARGGVLASLSKSLELSARLGTRRQVALGALAAAVTSGALLAVVALFRAGVDDLSGAMRAAAILAAPIGIIPGPPIAAALLSRAYAEASGGEGEGARLPASRRLRALFTVAVPALMMVAGTLLVAAFTPTPMRPVAMEEPVRRGIHGEGITVEAQRRMLPRAEVTTTGHGVIIAAADGGGAGEVDARFDTHQSALFVEDGTRYGGAPGTFAVVVTDGDDWGLTLVNADGVRQDDSVAVRVLRRLGGLGSAALFVGLALLLLLAFKLGSELGEARALSAPDLHAERGRGTLAALEGTLRLGEGAEVRSLRGIRFRLVAGSPRLPSGAVLSVQGEVWLEADGGALRFRVPEGWVPVLGTVSGTISSGPAVLLSRFSRVSPAGLREAGAAWPPDARLVIGRKGDAIEALVARASAGAAWLALPALVALVGAAARLLTAL